MLRCRMSADDLQSRGTLDTRKNYSRGCEESGRDSSQPSDVRLCSAIPKMGVSEEASFCRVTVPESPAACPTSHRGQQSPCPNHVGESAAAAATGQATQPWIDFLSRSVPITGVRQGPLRSRAVGR